MSEIVISPHTIAQSPGSDISPKTPIPHSSNGKAEYFPPSSPKQDADQTRSIKDNDVLSNDSTTSSAASPALETPSNEATGSPVVERAPGHRKSSVSSLIFQSPRNPSLPQGQQRPRTTRVPSPPPQRFQSHVAFDNLPLGEATDSNTLSLTLNVRHKGYQARRRSRTFMVGVDEHTYSDYALQWLLDELVDDGDEIICVRVLEKEIRGNDKSYQDDAQALMQSILKRNGANRAISVVLEYASGKLHSTFQKLIHMYQPAMLIVGTRGRSLGGLQGLVNTRNSFSKYCLQYSPVPVVVVRPTEKREKKKSKRLNDTERQTYVRMLSATGGKHEADSEKSSLYEVEVKISADEEAHQVAKELGLPASFDPTIKPLKMDSLHPRHSLGSSLSAPSEVRHTKVPAAPSTVGDSDEDESDDDDEFEVMTGEEAQAQALDPEKKEKLHKMEVGEAAALLKQNRKLSAESGAADDDDEDDDSGKHSRTSSTS